MTVNTITTIKAACTSCDGYGIVPSKSGLMTPDLTTLTKPSKKGGKMSITQAQEHINKMKIISDFDTTTHNICPKCGGRG